ncbi:MAG: hypothetical protein FWF03_02015, partial [Defluviitaleaceae bacterium]|nr:hypothetical protein [Defluviitaleaceae bacterium]
MRLFGKYKNNISVKVISMIFVGIVTLSATLTTTSTLMIRSVFEQLYMEKLMTAPLVLLAQYAAEDFAPFIEKLGSSPAFTEGAAKYLEDRRLVGELDGIEGAEHTEGYYAAKNRMAEYRKAIASLKDEDYFSLYKRLLEVRVGTGVKYLYVVADLGIEGAYAYIFNAIFQGDTVNAENDDFGTLDFSENFPQIERVFSEGESVMEYGNYGSKNFGALCYSYTPVLDRRGNVTAVIGVDINLQSLNSQLETFVSISIFSVVLITLVISLTLFLTLRKIIINPIKALTEISGKLAAGNIDNLIPEWITARPDEMGKLGRSYESMNAAVREMYFNNNILFEAVFSGKLGTRIDSAPFQGYFAQLVLKMNETLDIIGA